MASQQTSLQEALSWQGAPSPFRLTGLQSRSITHGNPTGAKGAIPPGKSQPFINIEPGETVTIADIEGPGMIRMIWMTMLDRSPEALRSCIIRVYWDDADHPAVLAPFGDFFGLLHGRTGTFETPYLGVSEGKGFHCSFPMPFASRCRIEIENDSPNALESLYYQINYTLGDEIGPDDGRFYAHFRRHQPPRGESFVLLDVNGAPGVYMGTAIGALPTEPGTWREGDIRFFIDGDGEQATITGTGWSDWFLSGWSLGPHSGLHGGSTYQVRHPEFGDKYFASCYRLHALDPIHFSDSLRVEIQQLGDSFPLEGWFNPRSDDWSCTVYWYQRPNGVPLPALPNRDARLARLEVEEWEAAAWLKMLSGEDNFSDSSEASTRHFEQVRERFKKQP